LKAFSDRAEPEVLATAISARPVHGTPFLRAAFQVNRWRRDGADDGNFDRPILISVTPVSTPVLPQ